MTVIVVDGRTDEEKLIELLGIGAEETALDFKATLDLSRKSSKNTLEFVKDAVAMSNLLHGGYIVVGVHGDGKPAHDQDPVDVSKFDSADLRNLVAKYVDAPVHLVAQRHTVGGRDVVLVYAQPNPDGLPVPFAAIGQYDAGMGVMKTVFREGEVVVREGTSNVCLKYAHWDGLLRTYRERIRAEARSDAQDLIARLVDALGDRRSADGNSDADGSGSGAGGGEGVVRAPVPLVVGMGWASFENALLTHLETASTIRIQAFAETAANTIIEAFAAGFAEDGTESSAYDDALDALTVIAIAGARFKRDDIYDLAVNELRDVYDAGGRARTLDVGDVGSDPNSTRHWLNVVERVLAIGRIVVANHRWALLPNLVHRTVPVMTGYAYETWIRHAHVAASRRNILNNSGGALLSSVRLLLDERPWLRPDVPTPSAFTVGDQLDPDDRLLNQLAEFDLWWCVIAVTRSTGRPGRAFYPSCAALHQHRCQSAIDTIATKQAAREEAFPDTTEGDVARALAVVVGAAARESVNYGGFWHGIPAGSPAAKFLTANGVTVLENNDW